MSRREAGLILGCRYIFYRLPFVKWFHLLALMPSPRFLSHPPSCALQSECKPQAHPGGTQTYHDCESPRPRRLALLGVKDQRGQGAARQVPHKVASAAVNNYFKHPVLPRLPFGVRTTRAELLCGPVKMDVVDGFRRRRNSDSI